MGTPLETQLPGACLQLCHWVIPLSHFTGRGKLPLAMFRKGSTGHWTPVTGAEELSLQAAQTREGKPQHMCQAWSLFLLFFFFF